MALAGEEACLAKTHSPTQSPTRVWTTIHIWQEQKVLCSEGAMDQHG